jgi:hypothetical protein
MEPQPEFPTIVYMDWNVFNKLEHCDSLPEDEQVVYLALRKQIDEQKIIVPYSNAHINDLLRGYQKDPSFTPGHLTNISALTQNLCITHYWGEPQTRWHYRDPGSFLEATLEEHEYTSPGFSSLFASIDEPLVQMAFELQKTVLRLKPMPVTWQQIYAVDPIFNLMYSLTKVEMNLLAFCEDLYAFAIRIKTDFALYKQHKKMMINLKNKFPTLIKLVNNADNNVIGKPAYLNWDDAWDDMATKFKSYKNAQADKILGLFTTTNMKGYRQDERFANMIDDALHCYYASHCGHFLSLDKRCADKAKLVFNKLKISTKVAEPEAFIQGSKI